MLTINEGYSSFKKGGEVLKIIWKAVVGAMSKILKALQEGVKKI